MIDKIYIEDYNYNLPDERIAKYPLPCRDSSKLLVYNNSVISEDVFKNLPQVVPQNSLIIFNETKVVPARLHFQKPTGAIIEVFCLQPHLPNEYNLSFAQTQSCQWKCVIGNAKKWKGEVLQLLNTDNNHKINELNLTAQLIEKDGNESVVEFKWNTNISFSEVLELCGTIPIPPYLNRESEAIDIERYQTLYAHINGSVAAPTAGLHFTQEVLNQLDKKGVEIKKVCLHVGAGTFLPVKSNDVSQHQMHREPFVISIDLLKELRDIQKPVIAVGTTSMRTLESLYYIGVSCIEHGKPMDVEQWMPYNRDYNYTKEEAIDAIINYLTNNNLKELIVGTKIIIVPSFQFKIVDYLVTNFHQPESTLILLVAAFVGEDWRKVYDYALTHDFRFLSYGDSSFLKRK